jgi:hypothetical protein
MGGLRRFDKARIVPPMPQQARADEADRQDHGGAKQWRLNDMSS